MEIALQFVGAGWQPFGRLSSLHNAIAFDALFGEKGKVGASIKAAVGSLTGGMSGADERISRLLDIRNALLHGEVGTVEASKEYGPYLEQFDRDPQQDQVAILQLCIQQMARAARTGEGLALSVPG
jgi:hypothetical protein